MKKHFVAIVLDKSDEARPLLGKLRLMETDDGMDMFDYCVAEKNEAGDVVFEQCSNPVPGSCTGAGFLGFLVGSFMGMPFSGMFSGAVAGLLAGLLREQGMDRNIIAHVKEELQPGSAAVFVLVNPRDVDFIKPLLDECGGHMHHCALAHDDETVLLRHFSRSCLDGDGTCID